MPEKVTADPVLRDKLKTADPLGVELVDEGGRVVGYAITPEQHRRVLLRLTDPEMTKAELDRRAAEPGEYTMDDVRRLFERP